MVMLAFITLIIATTVAHPVALDISELLGISNEQFYNQHFGSNIYLSQRNDAHQLVDSITTTDRFAAQVVSFDTYLDNFVDLADATTPRSNKLTKVNASSQTALDSQDNALELFEQGHSFVISFGDSTPLTQAIASVFPTTVTMNAYITPPKSQALDPHTDRYDVFIIQLSGTKTWTTCVPQPEASDGMTDADKAQLAELQRESIDGCTSYTKRNLDNMTCDTLIMQPGNVLYMPKGIVHYAVANDTEASSHLTIAIQRQGRTWMDVVNHHCEERNLAICATLSTALEQMRVSREGLILNDLASIQLLSAEQSRVAFCKKLKTISELAYRRLIRENNAQAFPWQVKTSIAEEFAFISRCSGDTFSKFTSPLDVREQSQLSRARRRTAGFWYQQPPCVKQGLCTYNRFGGRGSNFDWKCDHSCNSNCWLKGFKRKCADSCDDDCEPAERGAYLHCHAGYYPEPSRAEGRAGRCLWCPSSKYSLAGDRHCRDCPPGKWGTATGARNCHDCAVGKYNDRYRQRSCTVCPSGKYQDQTGKTNCKNAAPGYIVPGRGYGRRYGCVAGKFTDEPTATHCKDCKNDPWPGTYQPQGSKTKCLSCPAGKYAESNAATLCKNEPGVRTSVSTYPFKLRLRFENSALEFAAFRLFLRIWRENEYASDIAQGYPREIQAENKRSPSVDVANLRPGQFYHVTVQGRRKNGGYSSTTQFELLHAQTTCGCIADDTSGAPTGLSFRQHYEKVYFEWVDQSYCEEGFTILRDGQAFTDAYTVVSAKSCETRHAPESVFEDIASAQEVSIGGEYEYCVMAYSSRLFSWAEKTELVGNYESDELCARYTIQWEARMTGNVHLQARSGRTGVPETTIQWRMGSLSGSTTTDADGNFELYFKTSALSDPMQTLHIAVSKESGGITHKYECAGVACTEQTILLQALTFDRHVEFTDVSTVAVPGNVFIGGTEHNGFEDGCPLHNVEVCAHDARDGVVVMCDMTDSSGAYVIPVAIGLHVYFQASFKNHTILRIDGPTKRQPSGLVSELTTIPLKQHLISESYFSITENDSLENAPSENNTDDDRAPMDFKDITTQHLELQMAGGNCNRRLGVTSVEFKWLSCPEFSKRHTFTTYSDVLELPAQQVEVEVLSVTHDAGIGDRVKKYLDAVGPAQTLVDLTIEEQTMRWIYHPPPTMLTKLKGVPASACSDLVVQRDRLVDVEIEVEERFWGGIAPCTWVEGSVNITNQLGLPPEATDDLVKKHIVTAEEATLLSKCYSGCLVDLELMDHPDDVNVKHSAHATLPIMIGEPNVVAPFTRTIYLSMDLGPQEAKAEASVVILGDSITKEHGSMDFPEYFPLMIVYDPPGDGSSATYEGIQSSVNLQHSSHAAYSGRYSYTEEGVKTEAALETCLGGFGVEACTFVTRSGTNHLHGGESDSTIDGHDLQSDNELTLTTTVSLTTSESEASEHLLVVPSLVVKFSEIVTISYNFTTCTASNATSIKWSLAGKGDKGNSNAVSIIPLSSVEDHELATLTRNRALELDKLTQLEAQAMPDSVVIQTQKAKIAKLAQAINGWRKVTNYINTTLQRAAEGKLARATNLIPNELTRKAMTLDMELVPNAQAEIDARDTLSFYGGGHSYTFSQEATAWNAVSNSSDNSIDHDAKDSDSTEQDVPIAGFFQGSENDELSGFSITHVQSKTTSSSSFRSFTLADDDAGDKFVVKMSRDPLFNGIIFSTIAGQSRCNHEPGTDPREQPKILLGQSPGDVLPYEAAVFPVTLRNLALETGTYELYVSGVDGVDILVNGETLMNGQVFELPPRGELQQEIHVRRESNKYSFAFQLGLRSLCDDSKDESVPVNVRYLEPCSLVDWAMELRREQTFNVRATDTTGLMEVHLNNPEAPERFWSDNDRLEAVNLMYRRENDVQWRTARLANGSAINFAPYESAFGYAKREWNVGALADGQYQIRARAQCRATSLDAPEGIDEVFSVALTGTIDRQAPKVFDHVPQPVDGIYEPGDSISVSFTEAIDCNRPLSFGVRVELMIGGSRRMVIPRSGLDIACEGRHIELSLINRVSASTLAGAPAVVTLTDIRDLVGNVIANPVTWSFVFQDVEIEPQPVDFNNVALNQPFDLVLNDPTSFSYQAVTQTIADSFASALNVGISRIQVQSVTNSSNGKASVNFRILNGDDEDEPTADELAMNFLSLYERDSSTLSLLDTNAPAPAQSVAESSTSNEDPFLSARKKAEASESARSSDDDEYGPRIYTAVIIFGVLILMSQWLIAGSTRLANKAKYVIEKSASERSKAKYELQKSASVRMGTAADVAGRGWTNSTYDIKRPSAIEEESTYEDMGPQSMSEVHARVQCLQRLLSFSCLTTVGRISVIQM
eukprot:TRINITY_DN12401_c0_g1_i6.p1 TRINITY_DN12401_c0_g1~~TRINITY_DN12401_c0_g1_i6.p1  ORF type:complete len:2361 (+),score=333.61 TRINITY_DN12401_c0_g1_i6:340-7422(+)